MRRFLPCQQASPGRKAEVILRSLLRSAQSIKTIPFSHLETDLKKTLNECADTGETIVVEMPDQRLLAIQSLDPAEDDNLIEELVAFNPKFQALVAKSKASPRKAFVPRATDDQTGS